MKSCEVSLRPQWKFIPENTENKVAELFRSLKRHAIARNVGGSRKVDAQEATASMVGRWAAPVRGYGYSQQRSG